MTAMGDGGTDAQQAGADVCLAGGGIEALPERVFEVNQNRAAPAMWR